MKRHFFYSLMVLVFACKGKTEVGPEIKADTPVMAAAETRQGPLKSDTIYGDTTDPDGWSHLYVHRASITIKNVTIDLKTHFELPRVLKYDSSFYFEEHFFIVRDKTRKVADTLELGLDGYEEQDFRVEDMSDSLHYHSLLLQLKWTGSSDIRCSHFVEWKGDSLRSLFYIDNLNKIKRLDNNTLSGFIWDRDEVVHDFQDDYPFTIPLTDYEPVFIKPEKQYIGYPSEALEDIQAYRLNQGRDTMPLTIKRGTKILIDTLYRNTKTIRLLIDGSVPAWIETDKLNGENITTNTAG